MGPVVEATCGSLGQGAPIAVANSCEFRHRNFQSLASQFLVKSFEATNEQT